MAVCRVMLLEGSIGHSYADVGVHGIIGDAWFGSMKAASAIKVRYHQKVLQLKAFSGLHPKMIFRDALQDSPGGISIVLKGTALNEVQLVSIGYGFKTTNPISSLSGQQMHLATQT